MQKSIIITIQIDNVTSRDLPEIEEAIEEALQEYLQKRINISLSEQLGPPIPPQQVSE